MNRLSLQPRRQTGDRPDVALIEDVALRADRAAFAALFERYAPRLIAHFSRRSHGIAEAEDLAQEAMLRVWTHAAGYRAELSAPTTWIFRIARHCQIDRLRKGARAALWSHELLVDHDTPSLDDDMTDRELSAYVARSLERLPSAQAEVVRATYLEERTGTEVAEQLAIPLGTVKSRLAHAMARLRTQL